MRTRSLDRQSCCRRADASGQGSLGNAQAITWSPQSALPDAVFVEVFAEASGAARLRQASLLDFSFGS